MENRSCHSPKSLILRCLLSPDLVKTCLPLVSLLLAAMACLPLSCLAACMRTIQETTPVPGSSAYFGQIQPGEGEPSSGPDADAIPAETTTSRILLTRTAFLAGLADLQEAAGANGLAAAWVHKDPELPESFLVVAEGQAFAAEINGFFYWFCEESAGGEMVEPLLLGIDRLFTEQARDEVAANGQYSEPVVERLLELSLQRMLQERFDSRQTAFILECYRRDFSFRMQHPGEIAEQTWTQTFDRIEVTYNASIFSTVLFSRPAKRSRPDPAKKSRPDPANRPGPDPENTSWPAPAL